METHPHIPQQPNPHLDALKANSDSTAARFSLSLPHRARAGNLLEDVITRDKNIDWTDFSRFLVVSAGLVDQRIWGALTAAGVPQIPIVSHGADVLLFGVKSGLKPLANEALYGRQSSDTYIGDQEIFLGVGRLYRAAYEATGQLLLDPEKPDDSPLDHLAISNFEDGQGSLFFYPPYKAAPQYQGLSPEQASQIVAQATEKRFNEQLIYNESVRQMSNELVQKVREGFGAV